MPHAPRARRRANLASERRDHADVFGDGFALEHFLPVGGEDFCLGAFHRFVRGVRHSYARRLVEQNRKFEVEMTEDEVPHRLLRDPAAHRLVRGFADDRQAGCAHRLRQHGFQDGHVVNRNAM